MLPWLRLLRISLMLWRVSIGSGRVRVQLSVIMDRQPLEEACPMMCIAKLILFLKLTANSPLRQLFFEQVSCS